MSAADKLRNLLRNGDLKPNSKALVMEALEEIEPHQQISAGQYVSWGAATPQSGLYLRWDPTLMQHLVRDVDGQVVWLYDDKLRVMYFHTSGDMQEALRELQGHIEVISKHGCVPNSNSAAKMKTHFATLIKLLGVQI